VAGDQLVGEQIGQHVRTGLAIDGPRQQLFGRRLHGQLDRLLFRRRDGFLSGHGLMLLFCVRRGTEYA
jgi:hypothetical protein